MIETLENDQQVLLLYLANELPEEDRLEVQRRLAIEEPLAAELDRLASMRLEIEAGLAQLDEFTGIGANADTVARHIGREIRQRLARPKVAASMPAASPRHGVLPWLVPAGVAAAIAVGVMTWVNHRGPVPDRQLALLPLPPQTRQSSTAPTEPEPNLRLLEQSFASVAGDDDSHMLARLDSRKDVIAQDEISSYLLNLDAAH